MFLPGWQISVASYGATFVKPHNANLYNDCLKSLNAAISAGVGGQSREKLFLKCSRHRAMIATRLAVASSAPVSAF